MTYAEAQEGRCLCGAVRISALLAGGISACHCEMCRRWSGGVQMGIDGTRVVVTGPVRIYRSSPFSERAWCEVCGSALWLRDVGGDADGPHELLPGLFDNAGDAMLVREVYADRAPDGYSLAGDHVRITKEAYERDNPHVDGGNAS